MLTPSHALSPGTVSKYYRSEYSAADKRYFSQDNQLQGEWQGKLAAELGLIGSITDEHFDRLANGQHPITGEQLIKHRDTYLTDKGVESVHRSAWDFTMHASKSVSLAALVGGDERIVKAHEAANRAAMSAMEQYAQARMGGHRAPATTEKWIVATFLHDTARPTEIAKPLSSQEQPVQEEKIQYAAVHLHSHNVVFNMTVDITGQARSLESKEAFIVQQLGGAVYQSEMAYALKGMGYEVHKGAGHAPEIVGFTREYIESESLRRKGIQDRMEELGLTGKRAAEIIAHQNRNAKLKMTPEEIKALHFARAEAYGNQPQRVVEEARARGRVVDDPVRVVSAQKAVTFAIRRLSERESVFDHYQVARDALRYGQGQLRLPEVEANIIARRQMTPEMAADKAKDLIPVYHVRENAPGARYTTPRTIGMERSSIETTRAGMGTLEPIATSISKQEIRDARTPDGYALNNPQMHAVWNIVQSHDRIIGLNGDAGVGKTSSLRLINEIAHDNGWATQGLAPTSAARNELEDAGLSANTLQYHLAVGASTTSRTVYFVDESSLASTKQVHQFLQALQPEDRAVFIGDIKQHQAVDAGRIFEELKEAGMSTFRIDKLVRQRDEELRKVVAHFAKGQVAEGLDLMGQQGRLHEATNRHHRYAAIAKEYVQSPTNTLVVSPDNKSRKEINQAIRHAMRETGDLKQDAYATQVLTARSEITKQDLRVASSYDVGNMVRFGRNNKAMGIARGDYGQVIDRDTRGNSVTVRMNGRAEPIRFDPENVRSVQLYKTESRGFAVGDRIQLTAAWKEQKLANRDLGTILSLDSQGNAEVKMDRKKQPVKWNLDSMRHIDYGYTMTSYSSQGKTIDRVLVQIDTGDTKNRALNDKIMLYVATSRGRDDIQIYTDNIPDLARTLDHVNLKSKGLSAAQINAYDTVQQKNEPEMRQQHGLHAATA